MNKIAGSLTLVGASIFLWLFYEQAAGVNQSIFALFAVGVTYYLSASGKRSMLLWGSMVAVLLLAIAAAYHGELWSRTMLLFSMWFMAGVAYAPNLEQVSAALQHGVIAPVASTGKMLTNGPVFSRKKRKTKLVDRFVIYLIPLVIIFLFLVFYSRSNPLFEKYLGQILDQIGHFTRFLRFGAIFTFILGLIVTALFVFRAPLQSLVDKWSQANPRIMRQLKGRKTGPPRFRGMGQALMHEYKAAFFLILSLNILLLLLNIADVNVVWIGFTWNGQLLKSFVHEGTWYLIISILISVGLIVYFFRGNLNFFSKSRTLRTLVFIWIAQNAFLAISVALRNYHYVEYYGLAYKRIGVFFFLAAIFAGLWLVFVKVQKQHTYRYWMNRNLALAFGTLAASGLFNWSGIITSYNLGHYKNSFVHMEFLLEMPDHTLPALWEYKDKLAEIKAYQLEKGFGYKDTIGNQSAAEMIESRTLNFLERYKAKTWQEWSFAESRAYATLKKGQP